MDALQNDRLYTYADYANWDSDARYELIDGAAHMMAGASEIHQRTSRRLTKQLDGFLDGKPCELFYAPFDVCLNAAGDDDGTVVQPDILVVCDRSKLDGKRCNGAPDMIIEIVSPSTSGRDRLLKFNKYLQAGVREYWIVDPDGRTVTVHILTDGGYLTNAYGDTDIIAAYVLNGCLINMKDVFAE